MVTIFYRSHFGSSVSADSQNDSSCQTYQPADPSKAFALGHDEYLVWPPANAFITAYGVACGVLYKVCECIQAHGAPQSFCILEADCGCTWYKSWQGDTLAILGLA